MTRKEAYERTAFENILADESSVIPAPSRLSGNPLILARLLCRHGKTYKQIQEAICNGPNISVSAHQRCSPEEIQGFYARHDAWCEKRENQLEKRIRAIVKELGTGFGVVFSGDPRGTTVKITVPSGRTNDYGHEGICVPTA